MGRINLPLAFFSLLISITLWFVAYAVDLPVADSLPVKVRLMNTDSANWVVDSYQGSVRLSFLATKDKMDEIEKAAPTVDVDLSSPQDGPHRYPAEINPPMYAQDLSPGNRSITVPVTLEHTKQKSVPIVVELHGAPKQGWVIKGLSSPKNAIITGAAGSVARITHCRVWLDLGQVDTSNPQAQAARLAALDAKGEAVTARIDPVVVSVTPLVTAAANEKPVGVYPDIVGQVEPGFLYGGSTLSPATVDLKGDPTILAATSEIKTAPIDISGLRASKIYRVRLLLPVNLKSVGGDSIRVRVNVKADPSYARGSAAPPPSSTGDFPNTVPPLGKGG